MRKKYKILIVDDSEFNRSLLTDMLSTEYEIIEAATGLEAVAQINKYHSEISLILLDIVMPEMDGFEVLAIMNKSGLVGQIPVIIISAETSSSYIDHAYDLGAADYVSRPFDEKIVQRRVKNTIMLYAKQKMLEGMVTEQILEKQKNNFLMVEILSNIVEFRNGESGLHVLHIRILTDILLKRLLKMTSKYSLTASQAALITNASALHDIGKISIPESILNKPGRLTPEEYEIMKSHSIIGAQILENAPYRQQEELIQVAQDICRWHHERYDGRGYPDGLKGEEIPISAQVVSLADVYDALTSVRVYKPAYSHGTAMRMILNGECGAFNPVLLQCLVEIGPRIEEELKVRSADGISRAEVQQLTDELLQSGNVSNRTLVLLEQERTKYQFFASMSKEIQFEYNHQTDLLTLSDWGARQLGINEIIMHPVESEELHAVFSKKDYLDLRRRLSSATPEQPVASNTYCLHVNGQDRWFKAVARPLWVGEESYELTGAIGKLTDVHEEQVELDKLKELAKRDPLTNLYNHQSVRRAAEADLATPKGKKFALFLFDLDSFKGANDQRGHLFGDEVLKSVAHRIQKSIRKEDIAARVGGDEFLIFMEYKNEIGPLAKRIFQSLCGEYCSFTTSVSMGVALYPQDGSNYEELFHCADQALYSAKRNGKSQYCFYDDSMQEMLSVLSLMDN